MRTVAHTSPSLEQGQLSSGHFPTSIEAGNSRLVTLQIRWLISALESQVIFFSLRRRWRLRPNLAMISHQIMHCNERTAAGAAAAATDARGTTLGPSASLSRAAAAIAANAFRTALAAARPSTSPRLLSSSPTDTLTSFPPFLCEVSQSSQGRGEAGFFSTTTITNISRAAEQADGGGGGEGNPLSRSFVALSVGGAVYRFPCESVTDWRRRGGTRGGECGSCLSSFPGASPATFPSFLCSSLTARSNNPSTSGPLLVLSSLTLARPPTGVQTRSLVVRSAVWVRPAIRCAPWRERARSWWWW